MRFQNPALSRSLDPSPQVVCDALAELRRLVVEEARLVEAVLVAPGFLPVVTGDLLAFQPPYRGLAAALGHAAGFPGLGLRRRLHPIPGPTTNGGSARHRPRPAGGEGSPGTVPTFTAYRLVGVAPSFSPATSPRVRNRPSRSLPEPETSAGRRRRPTTADRRALLPGPHPPGSSRSVSLEGYHHCSCTRTPFHLACRTRAVWQYRPVPSLSGLLLPAPAPPGSAGPSFTRLLRQPSGGLLPPARSPRTSWRTVSSTQQQSPTACRQGPAASASGGVNRCTDRYTVTWSTSTPRSASNSSAS
jgi:hypothetical protein